MYSFNKCLLSIYCVPVTFLDSVSGIKYILLWVFLLPLAFSSTMKFREEDIHWELRGPVNLRQPRVLWFSTSQCFHHRGCQLRLWKISDICCISLKLNLMHSQLADNEGSNQKYCQKLRLKNPVWKTGLGEQFSWAAEMLSPAPNPPPSPGLKVLLYFCLR